MSHHLWKRFRADRRRRLLRDEIQRVRARMRGDIQKGWRWALRDVDFSIAPGESVGLVGSNGSGKTTLLKLLARVMYPYAGDVEVSGRVGALIEVRAGIHPDLSGRENVYITGSLLGLSRRDVAVRFDDIVEFAGLEDAIDRQVKFYSSGMQMRLGFSIAAFLEPDVLLVDEVLAVGDASFQQRCLDRMRHLLTQGTTLVFVSHDLAAVEATCNRGIWLRQGVVEQDGPIRDVLGSYRRSVEEAAEALTEVSGVMRLLKSELECGEDDLARSLHPLGVRLVVESPEPRPARICIGVSEGTATPIFVLGREVHFGSGETEVACTIESLPVPQGHYYLWTGIFDNRGRDLLPWHPVQRFTVSGPRLDDTPRAIVRLAPVHVRSEWATT